MRALLCQFCRVIWLVLRFSRHVPQVIHAHRARKRYNASLEAERLDRLRNPRRYSLTGP